MYAPTNGLVPEIVCSRNASNDNNNNNNKQTNQLDGFNLPNWLTTKMRRPEDDGPTLAVLRSGHTIRLMSCRK